MRTSQPVVLNRLKGFVPLLLLALLVLASCNRAGLPERYGMVEHRLFLSQDKVAPLIVAFGGSEGGMVFAEPATGSFRDSLLQLGYHVLAIAYFGGGKTPKQLDRISLDAIYDTIRSVSRHPQVDAHRIALFGGSRGGELVLNLAARFPGFGAVMALVPANVTLPNSISTRATSSWTFQGEEVPFLPVTDEALRLSRRQGFLAAFRHMLDQGQDSSEIPVEQIEAPLLLVSAEDDEIWPSKEMCQELVHRLEASHQQYYFEHVVLAGSHRAPADDSTPVFNFLAHRFPAH